MTSLLSQIPTYLSQIATFLTAIAPTTVLAAIALFITKEVLEGVRRHRSDQRKRLGLRMLLARECELNHWTIKSIRTICTKIEECLELEPDTQFRLVFTRAGEVHFRAYFTEGELHSGCALPDTHKEILTKFMLDIATLDKALFPELNRAFEAVSELEHLRRSLINYIEPEDSELDHLEGFTGYALGELSDIYDSLASIYKKCTGKDLVKHQVR